MTTCDCKSATGLYARKKLREEVASGATAPSYYDTRVATASTTELRTGLVGACVLGVVGADGGAFYMVKGYVASVLRCRHGHTTHTLRARARERKRYAAALVAAALLGRRIAGKALGGVVRTDDPSTSRGTRRVLVRLVAMLHAAREGRRARRGGAMPCGCAAVFVKASVKGQDTRVRVYSFYKRIRHGLYFVVLAPCTKGLECATHSSRSVLYSSNCSSPEDAPLTPASSSSDAISTLKADAASP